MSHLWTYRFEILLYYIKIDLSSSMCSHIDRNKILIFSLYPSLHFKIFDIYQYQNCAFSNRHNKLYFDLDKYIKYNQYTSIHTVHWKKWSTLQYVLFHMKMSVLNICFHVSIMMYKCIIDTDM